MNDNRSAVPVADLGVLAPAGAQTWTAIAELATLVPADRWAIVGGQMVAIRAAIAGRQPPRVTDDGDVVVDVRSFRREAMRSVAAALTSAGFRAETSPDGVTRFERDRAKIDLLAPEGVGRRVETIPPGHAVQAPGTTQALSRTELVEVTTAGEVVTVRCPTLLGAVIAKAAGSTEIASLTSAERLKHQTDLLFLLSLVAASPAGDIDAIAAQCTRRDRDRLRRALAPIFEDRTHRARSAAPNMGDIEAVTAILLG